MNKQMGAVTAAVVMLMGGAASVVRAENDMPNAMDKMFVMKAAQGNIAEIKVSRLALQKSKDEGVRKVATMLITEHGQAQESLKQAAGKVKMMVPGDTDPMHKAEARKLARMSGIAFDKMYIKGQVRDHYKTIALFNKELAKGSNSTVQGFATQYLPGIQTHTEHIVAQAGKLGVATAEKVAHSPSATSAQ